MLIHFLFIYNFSRILRALILEAEYDPKNVGPYYRYKNSPMAHLPFNFQFCSIRQKSPSDSLSSDVSSTFDLSNQDFENISFTPRNVKRLVHGYEKILPKGSWTNWQVQ